MSAPLLYFVHGFLGSPKSLYKFPADLKKALRKRKLYSYETHDEYAAQVSGLTEALSRVEWRGRPVIIIGHSMGGLLAVDAAVNVAADPAVNVKAVLAFDSPFFGVREDVFGKKTLFFLPLASSILSSKQITFAIVVAALVNLSNEEIKQKVDRWVSKQRDNVAEYAQFLRPLWNIEEMTERFDALGKLKEEQKLVFKCIYAARFTTSSATSDSPGSFITHPAPEINSLFDFKPIRFTVQFKKRL
ncbi:hypothetical protein BDK51DRAFT_52229 [Blyttiomyces helicus]|uniref:Serine aminopeptidase S33 domain-containing protein n=1 Tax=Blyttiomyces helicus TaxID=388810 RepID=A0A4P9WM78_9FUNG|nr:hypothetical protein BDK51DRAFT_52229 [Blyttiomyces helicus]|eukprot:RKO94169.1 hypothetical protein BDK51DRAFT_52229 [Blyttiomyces helicus]